jgi:hypothetical protein
VESLNDYCTRLWLHGVCQYLHCIGSLESPI